MAKRAVENSLTCLSDDIERTQKWVFGLLLRSLA